MACELEKLIDTIYKEKPTWVSTIRKLDKAIADNKDTTSGTTFTRVDDTYFLNETSGIPLGYRVTTDPNDKLSLRTTRGKYNSLAKVLVAGINSKQEIDKLLDYVFNLVDPIKESNLYRVIKHTLDLRLKHATGSKTLAEWKEFAPKLLDSETTLLKEVKEVLKKNRLKLGVANTVDGYDFSVGSSQVIEEDLGSEPKVDARVVSDNLRKDAFKSTDGMKAIVEELDDVDAGYKKYVLGLLDKINPSLIPELNLYINKEAERNAGVLRASGDLIVDVAPNMTYSDKTATEVYAHELMHAITKFAINSKNPEVNILRIQLQQLRDEAMEIMDYKTFMPDQYLDKDKAEKRAKELYDYVFTGKSSLHEFVAYGLTNPKVMNMLKAHKSKKYAKESRGLFAWLVEVANKVLDAVMGKASFSTANKTMKKQLEQLSFELMQYNNEAIAEVQKQNKTTILGSLLDVSNDKLSKGINVVIDYVADKDGDIPRPTPNASKIENAIFMAKFLPKLILDDRLKGIRNTVLSSLGMKPENMLQNIVRDVETPGDLERLIEQAEMDAGLIDQARELTVDVIRDSVKEGFKRKLTKVEEEAITMSALDVDIGVIYNEYGSKRISELLTNPTELTTQIKKATTELRRIDKDNFNWNHSQSIGLGIYLVTGKAGYAQNLNASNIASGLLSNKRRRPNKEAVKKIDELSTLMAIQRNPSASNKLLANLIDSNPDGVQNIVSIYEGSKKDARNKVFETDVNVIKGYSKELFDDSIDVKVKAMSQRDEMEMAGYELVHVLSKDTEDKTEPERGLFRSKMFANDSYNRGATRMTNIAKRGTSLGELQFADGAKVSKRKLRREIDRIRKVAKADVEAMENGTYTFDKDQKLSPVLNQDGLIVDYRYMMGKDLKRELLNQDTTVAEVLGRTVASVKDKVDTNIQNKAVLEIIYGDMKENYVEGSSTGRNGDEYVKIESNSNNPKIQEIYKLLPRHMKQSIEESDKKYIAVKRAMLHNYFGFRDASIVDFFGIHHVTPEIMQKWIKFAEKLWQQIVSISKVDVIIRTPAVFIGNVISNFMYSVVNVASPLRVLKMQVKNMQNVSQYIEAQRKIENLKVQKLSGKTTKNQIARMERELALNPVHDLMEAGMYQAIVEDLNKQDFKSSNKLARKLNEATETTPEWIKTGVNWLFLNENTSYFKLMTKATQYSDFVARATEYQLLQERGVDKEAAKQQVLDVYINYGKPASQLEEYLNNMGLFMFTKYMKRITRVVHKSIKDKPLNVLLSVLGQEAFFEVDDIQDQNLLTRSYTNLGHYDNMFDHIKRMYTPTALQFAGIVD